MNGHNNNGTRITFPPWNGWWLFIWFLNTFELSYNGANLKLSFDPCLLFCQRPSAKDQGITWVLVVLVLVVHHLVHFLLKIHLSEKNSPFLGNEPGPLAPQPSTLSTELWQLSYKLLENYLFSLRISKTTPPTLDQYCSTLVSAKKSIQAGELIYVRLLSTSILALKERRILFLVL